MRKLSLWTIHLYNYWLSILENATIALLWFFCSGVLDFFFGWTYPQYLFVPKFWVRIFWSYLHMLVFHRTQEIRKSKHDLKLLPSLYTSVVLRMAKSCNQIGHHFLRLKMLLVFCLLMKRKFKLLFQSFMVLFQILSIITQHSVW